MKLIRSAQSIRILALMAVLTVLFSNCNQEGYRTNSVLPPENGHANQDDSSLTDPTQNPTPDNTGNSGNTGNSNNNPFGNGDATTTFDVHPESSLTSGLNDSYHLKVLMDINTTDLSMSGAFFLLMIFNNEKYFCTFSCKDVSNWKKWVSTDSSTKWSVSGLKSQMGANALSQSGASLLVYDGTLDMVKFGGAELYSGYGLGANELESANEMLNSNRFKKVSDITIQKINFIVGDVNIGSSISNLEQYDLKAVAIPSMEDYGKPGYYFVVGQSADGKTTYFKANRGDGSGQYDWVKEADITPEKLASHYTDMAPKLLNKLMIIYQGNATELKGFKVYIGYGVGNKALDAANDLMTNNKYNAVPFVIGK